MSIIENSRFHRESSEQSATHTPTRPHPYEDETISLIDLLAVVLRHRRIIIGGTAAAAVLTAAALFLLPLADIHILPPPEYTAQRRLLLDPLPEEVQAYLGVDLPATVMSVVNDPRVIGEVYRPYDDAPEEGLTPEGYLTRVRDNVIGNRFTAEWEEQTRMLVLSFTANDSGDARSFLETLEGDLRAETVSRLAPRIEDARGTISTALENTRDDLLAAVANVLDPQSATQSAGSRPFLAAVDADADETLRALADHHRALAQIEALGENGDAVFSPAGGVTVFEEDRAGRSMILIITVITAFFLTVFLAFVVEYIHRVRQEPEEMEKIAAAWRGRRS